MVLNHHPHSHVATHMAAQSAAAPPSAFSRCMNRDGEGVSSNSQNSRPTAPRRRSALSRHATRPSSTLRCRPRCRREPPAYSRHTLWRTPTAAVQAEHKRRLQLASGTGWYSHCGPAVGGCDLLDSNTTFAADLREIGFKVRPGRTAATPPAALQLPLPAENICTPCGLQLPRPTTYSCHSLRRVSAAAVS